VDSVAARAETLRSRALRRVDGHVVSTWLLAGGLVLYLAMDGGGYDIVVRSQVGIVVWWLVLVGAAWGVLPATRISRAGWTALALFGGYAVWTALGATWSPSTDLSLQSLSLVAGYLGVLLLALGIHRDREQAVRHTLTAIASAGVVVAGFALASRLRPDLFAAAHVTSAFLPGTQGRIAWPLNYWNALGALIALVLPLLLANATSGRTLLGQAAAAGAIPMVALCGYLTFSRGSAFAAAGGLLVFLVLAEHRISKLATVAVTAGGSAILIAGAVHRPAVEKGLLSSVARHQGATLLVAVVLVCGGVAMAQVGIGLATRHAEPPRWLRIPLTRARWLLAGAVIAAVVVALAAGAPTRLSHAWRDFQRPAPVTLHQNNLNRFGSTSGNGRYNFWKVAVDASGSHLLRGWGPGAFQVIWPNRTPVWSPALNAHSLYLETLLEGGVVGLALLAAFLALLVGTAIALAARSRYEARTRAAAVAAASIAFVISAGVDWVWQVPALPVAFVLLCAAALAPRRGGARSSAAKPGDQPVGRLVRGPAIRRSASVLGVRLGLPLVAVAGLVAIGVPLAATTALRRSQAAAASGNTAAALLDARAAERVEPNSASPQLQEALVLELRGDYTGALVAVHRATSDEPLNWQGWLVRSRLQAEAGQPAASLASYRRAKSLNPKSPLFAG
jgi:hypothetical protein